jgi:hypothetical protein
MLVILYGIKHQGKGIQRISSTLAYNIHPIMALNPDLLDITLSSNHTTGQNVMPRHIFKLNMLNLLT